VERRSGIYGISIYRDSYRYAGRTPMENSLKKKIKSHAHHLKPLIIIGQKGVTDTLIQALSDELERNEVVKVKFNEYKEEKKELSSSLAETVDAHLVDLIGNIAILYRQNSDQEKRIIT
jgi:RNA-binding protein